MTDKQKQLYNYLMLEGYYMRTRMSSAGDSIYVVYFGNQQPIRSFSRRIGDAFKDYFKKDGKGRITLNLNLIRQMDGRTFMKKTYKKKAKAKLEDVT